jgi:hypothetical protein
MPPRILRNINNQMLIELSRTDKRVRVITLLQECRDIREIPLICSELIGSGDKRRTILTVFDKDWRPVPSSEKGIDYPVEKAAMKWLDADFNHHIPLTERAKKELVMLILAILNSEIQKFATIDAAVQACPTGTEVIDFEDFPCMAQFSNGDLVRLYNLMVTEDKHITKFTDKATGLKRLTAAAQAYAATLPEKKNKVKKKNTMQKVGDKEKLRAAIIAADKNGMTVDEMVTLLGCDKKRCSDYICHLKNPKYCGSHGVLATVKKEGRYFAATAATRRVADRRVADGQATLDAHQEEQHES